PPGGSAEVLRRYSEPLPARDSPEFGALFDRFGDASVVLIGEASHGTQDFYQTRAAITRRLIEQHGFGIVAVEADWPDAGQIDRCVRDLGRSAWKKQVFARFPTWMWRNTAVQTFTRWLHHHNRGLTPDQRVEFRGLDVYSMRHSIDEVLSYLDKTDPQLAKEARHRYSCLTPWHDDPALYGHFAERGNLATCEDAVVEQLHVLLGERLDPMVADDEAFFSATQNARVVRAAEQYYRAMYRGSTASWNLRDRHMFDTLQTLMAHRGAGAKAVVWAHNSHIGNAAATQMGWEGQFNIGQLCRTAYGSKAVLIGMGTDHGTVAAADDWDEPMQIKQVNPALADSWEQLFLQAGVPAALLDWRTSPSEELLDVLAESLLERAIGVIYRPGTERQSHYFQAVLAEQFDAYIWIEKTHAVSPLPAPEFIEHEEDTFPFGL
ncbi:MAG TPA: erythromycin esterase family protein, partial [Pseudomonas sp.]|nr:erythromycin esterase family protein [Pseudomonas sp.]